MTRYYLIITLAVLTSCNKANVSETNKAANGIESTDSIYAICPDDNHPHMVDLGLPSGTQWACCNLEADSPEENGGYFAWGETSEKETYDDVSYIHCDGDDPDGNGWYDGDIQWADIGTNISGTKYDAAHVRWNGEWRMPTAGQFQELINGCECKWTWLNGKLGQAFVSKTNGQAIFLPAAGCRIGSDPPDNDGANGPWGGYWSGTRHSMDQYNVYHLYICQEESKMVLDNMWGLVMGMTIRPVTLP